jgi:hypothetical protein
MEFSSYSACYYLQLKLIVFLCSIFILEKEIDGKAMMGLTENDSNELLSETNSDGSKNKAKIGTKRNFELKLNEWKTKMEVPSAPVPKKTPRSTRKWLVFNIQFFWKEKVYTIYVWLSMF